MGPVAAPAAELRVDLNELSLPSAQAARRPIAARSLVGDPVEDRVVEVEDGDGVLGAEGAAGRSEAVAFFWRLYGGVPFEGVLADVDVLGSLHLLDDVLGVLDAGKDGAPGAGGGCVAASAAAVGLDTVGDDHGDGYAGGLDAGHHEAVGYDPGGGGCHGCGGGGWGLVGRETCTRMGKKCISGTTSTTWKMGIFFALALRGVPRTRITPAT